MTEETIVAAAVRAAVSDERRATTYRGQRCYPDHLTITAPPPARHHTLLHITHDLGLRPSGPADQGFITSTGRYVDRDEGLRIALASGQRMINGSGRHTTQLFSEDLW